MIVSGINVTIRLDDLMIIGSNGGVSLHQCLIQESLEYPLPNCTLSFDANDQFLKDHPITDGTLVEIHLYKDDNSLNEYYTFRVYNLDLGIMNNYIRYTLSCYLDVYQLFFSGEGFAANTYSSEIFRSVAKSLKIPSNIDTTLDKQLWVPSNFDLLRWLSNISKYGYIDELSCMLWGIEKNKTLLYKNLSSIIKSTPKENLLKLIPTNDNNTPDDNSLPYNSAQPTFYSGIENLRYRGYGGYDTYFHLPSYSSKKVSASKVVASSNMLNINRELSQGLEPTQQAFDVGNFHQHYYEAYMQNLRQLSTYSTYMTVLLEEWSNKLRLLTPVILEYSVSGMNPNSGDSSRIESLSSVYVIDKVTTIINAGEISQAIQIMGQGYNTTRSTGTY